MRGSARTSWSRSRRTGSALLALLLAFPAAAAELTASVDRRVVNLGEEITLTLSISGVSQTPGSLSLPQIDGFSVRPGGTTMRVLNARVSHGYQFFLTPLREGDFEIPSFSLKAGGRTLKSEPIQVKVAKAAKKLIVRVAAEKGTVYVGEAFRVSLVVGIGDRKVESFAASCPWLKGLEGFRVFDPLDLAEKWQEAASVRRRLPGHELIGIDGENRVAEAGQEIIEGSAYAIYTVRRMFVAKKPGSYALSPSTVRALVVTGYRRERDPFFDDPLFGPSLFTRRRAVTKTVADASDEIEITVIPLPPEDRPERFGGVGQFTMKVEASPTELKLGETITLKVTLAGQGDLDTLAEPRLTDESGLLVGEPEIRKNYELRAGNFLGTVEFLRPLRPKSAEVEELPELSLSYFDVEEGRYVTLRQPPVPVRVSRSEAQPLVIAAPAVARGMKVVVRAEGLSEIARVDELKDHGRRLHATALGWALFFLPPFGFAALAAYSRRATKLREDVAYRRRTRALARALDSLKEAEGAGGLANVLAAYIADKVDRAEGEMPAAEAGRILEERGSGGLAREAEGILSELESARFAGGETALSRERMESLLRRLEGKWRA